MHDESDRASNESRSASGLSRRDVVAGVGSVLGGAAVLSLSSPPALAVDGAAHAVEASGFDEGSDGFTATDLTVETDDGVVGDLTVGPTLTVHWDGLDAPPATITCRLFANDGPGGSMTEVGVRTFQNLPAILSGSTGPLQLPQRSLFDTTSWSSSVLRPPQPDGDDDSDEDSDEPDNGNADGDNPNNGKPGDDDSDDDSDGDDPDDDDPDDDDPDDDDPDDDDSDDDSDENTQTSKTTTGITVAVQLTLQTVGGGTTLTDEVEDSFAVTVVRTGEDCEGGRGPPENPGQGRGPPEDCDTAE